MTFGVLWIQQTAAQKRAQCSNVLGTTNPVDLTRKYPTADVNDGHCARLSVHFAEGRAKTALTLCNLQICKAIWNMGCNGVHVVTNDDDDDEYKDHTEARFEQVVNNWWCRRWKKVAQSQVETLGCAIHDLDYNATSSVRQHPGGKSAANGSHHVRKL